MKNKKFKIGDRVVVTAKRLGRYYDGIQLLTGMESSDIFTVIEIEEGHVRLDNYYWYSFKMIKLSKEECISPLETE